MDHDTYDYKLPPELIAHAPAEPRDSSRLFVYDTKTDEIALDTFSNIARYLPPESLLVVNDTKVVPARLELKKLTGGAVKILFLLNEWDKGIRIKGLPDKGLDAGEHLFLETRPIVEIESHRDEEFAFKLLIPPADFERLCAAHGLMPLPPYIKSGMSEEEKRSKYQTTFAEKPASVAAPTASLHFTDKVIMTLADKGIEKTGATLHVGRGTFSPVSAAQEAAGALHPEPIEISAVSSAKIAAAKNEGWKVIAAGTTAVRILESAAADILEGKANEGQTVLFIRPPYNFKVVDILITNFHLPKTSLLMLVDAFLRYKGAKRSWRDLYARAIAEKFRFYSFGDAMLIR